MNYYNDIEPFACDWLESLIAAGQIPAGRVDRRSIKEVNANDLKGYTQQHFFAGIAGWPLALRLAGWPEDREVWSGSCPCQPFSEAGKRKGAKDDRHLWPELRRLIGECRPATVFGEQVASGDGRTWLAGVRADLEDLGYAVGAADLCAAGSAAPHIRQRLFWVGSLEFSDSDRPRGERSTNGRATEVAGTSQVDAVGDTIGDDLGRNAGAAFGAETKGNRSGVVNGRGGDEPGHASDVGAVVDSAALRRAGSDRTGEQEQGAWARCSAMLMLDGKTRRFEPESFPMAPRIPKDLGRRKPELRRVAASARRNRVGRLRGYGNSIVPQVAATFIRAFMEISGNA